ARRALRLLWSRRDRVLRLFGKIPLRGKHADGGAREAGHGTRTASRIPRRRRAAQNRGTGRPMSFQGSRAATRERPGARRAAWLRAGATARAAGGVTRLREAERATEWRRHDHRRDGAPATLHRRLDVVRWT